MTRADPARDTLLPYPDPGCYRSLSEEERRARLRALMLAHRPGRPIWCLAYGSLMWKPAFEPHRSLPVYVPGFRRRFGFWTCSSRGSPEAPGLGLGIEPGVGGCHAVAQQVGPDVASAQLEALWDREMGSGVYQARWITSFRSTGAPLPVIAFVTDPEHPQHAPALPLHQQARIIAAARGQWGSCRDYLAGVVHALRELGRPDDALERLLAAVDGHCATENPET